MLERLTLQVQGRRAYLRDLRRREGVATNLKLSAALRTKNRRYIEIMRDVLNEGGDP